MMLKKRKRMKKLLSLSLVCTLVSGLFVCADILYPTKENDVYAAFLTDGGSSNITPPEFYKTDQMPVFSNNGNSVYTLADNEWYGVTDGSVYWELVDTDADIAGTALSSGWGSDESWNTGSASGQIILNYTNGMADTYFEPLKKIMQTADVTTNDYSEKGRGAISNAYMWPLSYTQLNANHALGGRIYANVGSYVWTRTYYSMFDGDSGPSFCAYIISDVNGYLSNYNMKRGFRVAPAFNLDITRILLARSTLAPQSFGAFTQTGGYLVADTAGGYADGFEAETIAGKSLIGFNWDAVYTIPYANAAEGGTIAAALYKPDGSVAYYGSLGTAESGDGTVYLNLSGVSVGEYTLALWEENGTSGLASSPVYADLQVTKAFDDKVMREASHIVRTEVEGEFPSAELHKFLSEERTAEYLTIDSSCNSLSADMDVLTDDPVAIGGTYSIPVYDLNTDAVTKGHIKYISAIICDDENIPIYYGKLDYVLEDTDTKVQLTIPTTLDRGMTYKLYLFEETASMGDDDTASVPVSVKFNVTYKSVSGDSSSGSVDSKWLCDTQDGMVWYYELDENSNAVNVWTKDMPDHIIDEDGCLNVPATMGKLKYPVTSIGGGTADTTFVPVSYNGYNQISFPADMTAINKYAFQGCQATINLVIPSQIKEIENKAFYKAAFLRSVTVKGADLKIGKQAFARCTRLTSFVDTGNNVTIGEMAFYSNPALSNVSLFDNVTIGDYAFAENSALTSLKMDLMSGSVGSKAFENCDALRKVYIPDTITAEAYAFNNCDALTDIEIDMKQLGGNVFANCPDIVKVILDGNVESVAYNWGGYRETPSEGSITEAGSSVSSNEKSSDREFYVFGRNTVFQFYRDINGNYYSAFGYARDNSDTLANHNYYRVTTVYYTTAEKLTSAEAIGSQIRTAEEAAYIENEGGGVMLTACCEDMEDIANKGISEVDAVDVGYMLSAHQAGKVGMPKDAADAKSIRESFLEQDYSMPTAQTGIAASYPASVSVGKTINKARFLVYPVYNDGTPYKAPYEADQYYIMDTDAFEALKMDEATAACFKEGVLTADEETFRQLVGDDSAITPQELDKDAVNGTQSVTIVAYGSDNDGRIVAYTTTVDVMITKKANDYDTLVNEYGSIGAVYAIIENLQNDIAVYKAEIIAATNRMWESLGIADKSSMSSMTTTQLLDNFNEAVAATMEASGTGNGNTETVKALEQALKEKETELARMTESYVAVVEQLNALLYASGESGAFGEVRVEDFIRVHPSEGDAPGKMEVWINGKWYEVVSGDPTSERGAIIKMEIKLEDGSSAIVDAVVRITDNKIHVSYTDPSSGGKVEENYDLKLQQMIKTVAVQLLQIRQELSAMNTGLETLEKLLGITITEGETTDQRYQKICEQIFTIKNAYENLSTDYDKIIRKIYGADESVDLSGKTINNILMQIDSLSGDTAAIAKQLQTAITGAEVSDGDVKPLAELLLEIEQMASDLATKSDLLQQIMDTLGVTDSAQILQQILSLQTKVTELTTENISLKKQMASGSAGVTGSGNGLGTNAGSSSIDHTAILAGQISSLTKENETLTKEKKDLFEKIKGLESEISGLNSQNTGLKNSNEVLVRKNEKLLSKNKTLENTNKALGKKIDALTEKNTALKSTVDSLKKNVSYTGNTSGTTQKTDISTGKAANVAGEKTGGTAGGTPVKQASPTTGDLSEKRTNGTTDYAEGNSPGKVTGAGASDADERVSGNVQQDKEDDTTNVPQKEAGDMDVNIRQVQSVVKAEHNGNGFGKVISIELPDRDALETGFTGNVTGLSMETLYAGSVETNGNSMTETTDMQKENANTIFTYYANHPEELVELGWKDAETVTTDKTKIITVDAMTSVDIIPSAIQISAFEQGIASMVDLTSTDFADGKVYLMVHESEVRDGLFDVALVKAENGSLDVALKDLSPVSVAEVQISDTASFDGIIPDEADSEGLAGSDRSNGKLKTIFIVLAVMVVGITGLLLLMKKQGTLNFSLARRK